VEMTQGNIATQGSIATSGWVDSSTEMIRLFRSSLEFEISGGSNIVQAKLRGYNSRLSLNMTYIIG